jgi:hypothetical protein
MEYKNTRTLSHDLAPNGDDYRRLAGEIRAVAARTPLQAARRELIELALKYDRRADHLDRR